MTNPVSAPRRIALAGTMFIILAVSACAESLPQQVGSATAAMTPEDEYRLAPGDKIHVIVYGEETLTGDYIVSSGGNLTFPLVGGLKATDKTVEQLQAALSTALSDGYVNNPRVTIQALTLRPFYILGEINKPGEYSVSTGLTLQQAIATAGGYTYRANLRRVYVKRANDTAERLIDLRDGKPVIIRAGDTIRIGERHF